MRRASLFLAASLLTAALAGCVTPGALRAAETPDPVAEAASIAERLSPLLDAATIVHEVLDVETRHGLVNVDLYRPDTPEGEPVPVILVASPYNNRYGALNLPEGGKNGDDNWIDLRLYNWMREQIIPRGYAFAQMDILGTRNSGGCQGIMNEAERQATADVIDWLGEQEWSTGKVGMIGKSYLGLSQLGAAVENPEHLVTIVPISAPTQDYAYHYYNGVPYLGNHLTNALYYGAFGLPPPDGDAATYGPRYAERLPCAPEALAASVSSLGDYSPRWQERDYRPLVPQMRDDISVYFIAGHQDWNVKPDHVLDIYNAIPGPKMGLWGQWGHDYPNINNFDESAFGEREDWYFTLHRWFDHWLKGIDTGIMDAASACPVESQGSDATWRCLDAFPPAPSSTSTYWPGPDGALHAEAQSGTVTYQDVAAEAALPAAQRFVLDVPERTRIAGVPNVTMRVSTTSAFNSFLSVGLGVERDGRTTEFTWGFLSLRHRDGLEAGKTVTPGATYDVAFGLYPVDHVLEPGDKLVLVLRGDSTGAGVSMLPNPTPGMQTVDLAGTSLTLPVVGLDRVIVPLDADELPAAYPAEDA